jgi:hypothetical protein
MKLKTALKLAYAPLFGVVLFCARPTQAVADPIVDCMFACEDFWQPIVASDDALCQQGQQDACVQEQWDQSNYEACMRDCDLIC